MSDAREALLRLGADLMVCEGCGRLLHATINGYNSADMVDIEMPTPDLWSTETRYADVCYESPACVELVRKKYPEFGVTVSPF